MVRSTAILLTVLTGFTGLVYEVTWQKFLATLLGSHSEATAAVLGIFLGGLAVGYALFGRVSTRLVERARSAGKPPPLLWVYGVIEACIGLYALVFPWLFEATQALSILMPQGAHAFSFALDVALCALLIGPPSILMGATIPFLTQALARSVDDATRFHALVYGFNTAGAFVGALVAGYWMIAAFGLVGTLLAMAAINIGVGAAFVGLDRLNARSADVPARASVPADAADKAGSARAGTTDSARADKKGQVNGAAIAGFRIFATAALLLGFAMMTLQTVLMRIGALSFGSSPFIFSMVVAVFVLCIALGSLAVSTLSRIPRFVLVLNLWLLLAALALLYFPLEDGAYWAMTLRSHLRSQEEIFYLYHFLIFLSVLGVLAPAVILSGATLPLIFHHLRRQSGDLGGVAGELYSWNTLGSLLGALLGGYALFYWLDLHEIYRVALAAIALAGALVTYHVIQRRQLVVSGTLLAAALVGIFLFPAWSGERLSLGLFRIRDASAAYYLGPDVFFATARSQRESAGINLTFVFQEDDPIATVSVLERDYGDKVTLGIVSNGKSDSSLPDEYPTVGLLSLLPALFAENVERAFVIGLGTGASAGELGALDSMRYVEVAEISPAVIRAAPLFDRYNQNASKNPKIRVVQGDAYRALLRSEGQFDVIVSEPSNPWVAGIEMLYSREFLTAARHRLTKGGVFAQWLQLYETSPEVVSMVLRTYAEVFPSASVWFGMDQDLLLLGFDDPEAALDIERLAERVRRPDMAAGLARCGIGSLARLLGHELLPQGVIHATPLEGEVHTLLHPRLTHASARSFFVGENAELPDTLNREAAVLGSENSLIRRYAASQRGQLSEGERSEYVTEACKASKKICTTHLAKWMYDSPRSAGLARLLKRYVDSSELKLERIKATASLYATSPARFGTDDLLLRAQRATDLFILQYQHAAPFSRRALAAFWRGCEASRGCEENRELTIQILGSLSALH